jgi:hypothetical protein
VLRMAVSPAWCSQHNWSTSGFCYVQMNCRVPLPQQVASARATAESLTARLRAAKDEGDEELAESLRQEL